VATSIAGLSKRVTFGKIAPYAANAKEAERGSVSRLLGKHKHYVLFEVSLKTLRLAKWDSVNRIAR
jgi:hypothetical protein